MAGWQKTLLKPGHTPIRDWSQIGNVLLHFRVYTKDGQLFESSYVEDAPRLPKKPRTHKHLPIRIGRKFTIQAWEQAVMTMDEGEIAQIDCNADVSTGYLQVAAALRDEAEEEAHSFHEHHHGDGHNHNSDDNQQQVQKRRVRGCGCGVDATERMARDHDLLALAGSPLRFELELVKAEANGAFERDLWEYEPSERPQEIKRLKTEGNAAFQADQWTKAHQLYERALAHVENLTASTFWLDVTLAEQNEIHELERACQLNVAACGLRQNKPAIAIEMCSKVLARMPHNTKALFRRAQAHAQMDSHLEQAIADFQACLDVTQQTNPNDRSTIVDIQRDLKAAQERLRKLELGQREMYTRMFK